MRVAIAILAAVPLLAQTPDPDFFEKKVRPIFAANCYACHAGKMKMGGVNLSTGVGATPEAIYQALTYSAKIKMPPPGKLAENDIATVKTWVDTGGGWPASTNTTVTAKSPISPEARKHWSF